MCMYSQTRTRTPTWLPTHTRGVVPVDVEVPVDAVTPERSWQINARGVSATNRFV